MQKIFFQKIPSPVGELSLYATEKALIRLLFAYEASDTFFLKKFASVAITEQSNSVLATAAAELAEYFLGKRKNFSVKIELFGTAFQKKAWTTLNTIPYGQTISYKEQAQKMNTPLAVRAVGTANGKNPIAIIVPCHRVVGSNGKLIGYNGGVQIKSTLLELEGLLTPDL